MKLILIVFLTFACLIAQDKLKLSEAIEISLEKSLELKKSVLEFEKSKLNAWASKTNMLPKINLTAGYNYYDRMPVEINPVIPFLSTEANSLKMLSSSLTLEQPIFTGFKFYSIAEIAENQVKVTEFENEIVRNNIILNTKTDFYNVYLTEILFNISEESVEILSTIVNKSKEFLKNQLITENDFLKVETRFFESKSKQYEAKNNTKIAVGKLNKTLQRDLTFSTVIDTNLLFNNQLANFSLDELIDLAKHNRAEFKKQKEFQKSLESQKWISRSNWFPQIFASGSYNYLQMDGSDLINSDLNDYWQVSINAKWNLWDWNKTFSEVEIVEQNKIQADVFDKLLTDKIELEVYRVYLKYENQTQKVYVATKSLNSAQENSRISSNKYENGILSVAEVIEATNSLEIAKENLAVSKIQLAIAKAELENVVGIDLTLRKN